MSLYRRRKKRRYCDEGLQTSQLRQLYIVSHLRRLHYRRNSDAFGHSVTIATYSSKRHSCDTFISVGIATLFYKRRYSDGFGWDGKNLGKFLTFGQKRRNQVSEFPPNVVVNKGGYASYK